MSFRIRHCVKCPKCHTWYLVGFSPYRNGAYLVRTGTSSAGSFAQVTRLGKTPRGTPDGERGSKKEGRGDVAAARARANCRRVMSILTCSSRTKSYGSVDDVRLCNFPIVSEEKPTRDRSGSLMSIRIYG